MATQTLPPSDDESETTSLSHIPADTGGPTEALVAATVGDRCVNCGSPMSSDQRYCVVCGERRGAARFSLPMSPSTSETAAASAPSIAREPRRPRYGSGATLVAGVATLLLAILVGVLIGHNTANNQKTIAAGPTKIIQVGGGGAAAPASSGSGSGSTAASGSAAGSRAGSSASAAGSGSKKSAAKSTGSTAKGKAKPTATKKPAISKQQAAAASSAASKVTGGSHVAPPTVTVGQKAAKGTPGVNKKTGKFDGSFFGG